MKSRGLTNTSLSLSEIGFGGAGLGNLLRPVNNLEADAAVQKAWQSGVRYFDSAPHYGAGLSERRMGVALHSLQAPDRVISSKVGRMLRPLPDAQFSQDMDFVDAAPFIRDYDYSYDAVMRSFEDSIQRMGVSRIDILLMHDIGSVVHGDEHDNIFKKAMDSGFKAMDELRSQGVVKSIGLGVNEWQVCSQTMSHADFNCFMVANCFTLLNNSIADKFVGDCKTKGVDLIVAAPFNSGILATGSENPSEYFYEQAPKEIIEQVKKLEKVCREFDVSLGAAAIQYPLRFDVVKSVVIGMTDTSRIDINMGWYQESIPEEFWSALKQQGLLNDVGP